MASSTLKPNPVDLKSFYRSIMQKDPLLYGHQFTVTFSGADLPSFIQNGTTYESITYYGKSTSLPSPQIQETTVAFLSQDFVVPRQVTFGDSWKVKILVDQAMRHYQSLYDWQNSFASLKLSGGGLKIIPNVQAHITLLDASLQYEISKFTLEGVFPSNIPDISMQYENNSTIVDFDCTFTYQYIYDEDNGNPLDANHRQGI